MYALSGTTKPVLSFEKLLQIRRILSGSNPLIFCFEGVLGFFVVKDFVHARVLRQVNITEFLVKTIGYKCLARGQKGETLSLVPKVFVCPAHPRVVQTPFRL
jgi:hypothetical protein